MFNHSLTEFSSSSVIPAFAGMTDWTEMTELIEMTELMGMTRQTDKNLTG